jgi:hypothetical protein
MLLLCQQQRTPITIHQNTFKMTPELMPASTTSWMQQIKTTTGIISSTVLTPGKEFMIRTLDLSGDLPLIHRWVHQGYAIPFWQMNGSYEMLVETYQKVLSCEFSHSLIGSLNGSPVCQLDVYVPQFDILGKYYEAQKGDAGIHLLLGPEDSKVVNFSSKVLAFFCNVLFELGEVDRIVAEPDYRNRAANWLARRLKFSYMGDVALPEKRASLYSLTREQFSLVPPEYLPFGLANKHEQRRLAPANASGRGPLSSQHF